MTREKFFESMGWVGMVTAVLMYVFYFPQIVSNLSGEKGSFIQPFMAGVNCTLWVAYGQSACSKVNKSCVGVLLSQHYNKQSA